MNEPGRMADRSDEGRIAALLEAAGKRTQPDPLRKARVHRAVRQAWQASIAARRRRRILTGVAIAATAALAVLAVFVASNGPRVEASPLATVEIATGPVTARRPGGEITLAPSLTLRQGDVMVTGPGGKASLRTETGFRLRADQQTAIELVSGETLFLRRGRIYLDTSGTAASIEVRTPYGVVTDIGTQFEVRSGEEGLRVRVRDGSVALERGNDRATARRGEELFAPASGAVRHARIDPLSSEWDWMRPLTSTFRIDGKPLADLLEWVSAETGYRIEFASPTCHERAEQTVLHGSLPSLPPMEALETILATTNYRLEVRGDRLHIGLREPEK